MEKEDKINLEKIKEGFQKSMNFLKQKKVVNIILIFLLVALVVGGIGIRVQNLDLLKDQTTGEYIPVALDPFYFLRIAETIVEQGSLPEIDNMRVIEGGVGFSKEILPRVVVGMFNVAKVFNSSVTLQFIDVISPVIFFALGLIVFFFFVYALTNSKTAASISSIFLALIPSYLYRTMSGFSDHESIGMFAFFLSLLGYTFVMKKFNTKKEENTKKMNPSIKSGLFGAMIGFLAAFTIASWGGISNFIFMIIPLSFGLFWLTKTKKDDEGNINKKKLFELLIFYVSYFLFTIISGLIFGYSFNSIIVKSVTTTSSLLNAFVFLFVISDFVIIKNIRKIPVKNAEKYRLLISFGIVVVLGIALLFLLGENPFSMIGGLAEKFLHPFGSERVGLTVAENAQPFLNDWIGKTGKIFFWLFFGGLITIGINLSTRIKNKKRNILFVLLWILFISGILFSRISSSNQILNGEHPISKIFYLGSMILFVLYFAIISIKEKMRFSPEQLIILSWTVFMLISTRGAVRLFFVLTPFTCFSAGYLISNLFKYYKKNKEELSKMILVLLIIGTLIASIFSFNNFLSASLVQAQSTGPSANYQWQKAMSWVRGNTLEDSIFLHWWDYGYWVEYLGERATLADGGHFQGTFRTHMIGRYILTNQNPDLALSFMKSNNVSHLLIDSTDLGKYGAYSKIGSDETGEDRFASIPVIGLTSKDSGENSTRFVYQNAFPLYEDITVQTSEGEKLLSKENTYFLGVVLEVGSDNSLVQPKAFFYQNNQQIIAPIRYAYLDGELMDFGGGIEGVAYVLKSIENDGGGGAQLDEFGALIYLSPKVFDSLFVQLYLMDDPFNKYPSIELAHSEEDSLIEFLKAQGANIGNFVYYAGDFRGPIKIWNVDYPDDILEKEEFLRKGGEYAEFDDLIVTE